MKTLDEFLKENWTGNETTFAAAVSDSGKMSVGQQHINRIRHGHRKASPALAKRIEVVTGGLVSKASLRPDLWGAEPQPERAA